MTIHRLSENILAKTSFNGAIANSTQNGTSVNAFGYRRAALVIDINTGASTTAYVKLQESADNSTFADVASSSQPATAQVASTEAIYLIDIDLSLRKQYLRAAVVGTGAAGNATADFLLYHVENAPPTQDNAALHV